MDFRLKISDRESSNTGDNSRGNNSSTWRMRVSFCNRKSSDLQSSSASSDRRHYGNGITVFDRGGFFLQVADVFVIEVDIDESAQFAIVGVEMPTQVGMPRHETRKRIGDGIALHLYRGLLSGILP